MNNKSKRKQSIEGPCAVGFTVAITGLEGLKETESKVEDDCKVKHPVIPKSTPRFMRVAIRCIYFKPVKPSCDIIDMDEDTWFAFLYGDKAIRIEIALKLLNRESFRMKVRDIAWFPMSGQNKLIENQSLEK